MRILRLRIKGLGHVAIDRDPGDVQPDKSHLIGPGNLLDINVFDVAEMNHGVRVASSGFVQFPLIGAVKATRDSSGGIQELGKPRGVFAGDGRTW